MICSRCLNEDVSYFYNGSSGYYCRKCIKFKRKLLIEETTTPEVFIEDDSYIYNLSYQLTDYQKIISDKLSELIIDHDVLVHCVCGAGKTEIVLKSISEALKRKEKVAFAISRRQVVLEIWQRLTLIFKNTKVIAICQGYTEKLEGELIVCTTHQLYRFPKTFDLLILDEPDAFPYKGDLVLKGIAMNSVKGHMIYSTATLDDYLINRLKEGSIKYLSLNKRPHNYPLPYPKVITSIKIILHYHLIKFIRSHTELIIVFVPTKKQAIKLAKIYNKLFKCHYINSDSLDKDMIIDKFKKFEYQVLFATTVLERGITIPNVLVVIMYAEHSVFDTASLIQMLGRVGRTFDHPTGDCLILNNRKNETTIEALKEINRANYDL